MRVLIIDDYESATQLIAMLVQLCGHEPQVAQSGVEALACAGKTKPDVVLVDLAMPGLDGYATARRLQDEAGLAGTPIYALSGSQPDDVLLESAGMRGHFSKPIRLEDLKQLMGAA